MDVVIAAGRDTLRWRAAFAHALPGATLHAWPDAPDRADFAAVWRPPAELFERVRIEKAVANLGAGVDALLNVPTLPCDVPILRLEDAGMAEQMGEYVTLAVLDAFRETPAYAAQQQRRQWRQRERVDKRGFFVGLLGLGVMARAAIAPLAALGFPLLGWSRSPKHVADVACGFGPDGLDALLARSRVLVCALPLTPHTSGLLDRTRLARLPRGAHVVNVARGPLIVEADLIALLDEGHLASATLDVFAEEPLPASHRFWHHPAVTITPHVSAATRFEASALQVADKFAAMLRGDAVTGVVERARGY
jgi:glyoxylate/hydroxypyruvate reductase